MWTGTLRAPHLEATHPDLFRCGVHDCEPLFTVMGTGCESVERSTTPEGKIKVIGRWAGGRTGTFTEGETYRGLAGGDKGGGPGRRL
jgi:hypothetical protein